MPKPHCNHEPKIYDQYIHKKASKHNTIRQSSNYKGKGKEKSPPIHPAKFLCFEHACFLLLRS